MAYQYLLDLYRALADRKATISDLQDLTNLSPTEAQHQQGRLAALDEFMAFLKQNYHGKLPRRLQKTELP